jgi:outer membrane lipopolysaccharide assembly protein LptE/RlpB
VKGRAAAGRHRPITRALTIVLALAVGGCGYGLRGTLPEHIKTVGVPMFVNRTYQPAVEALLTRAVVEAFSTNGRLRVVRPEQADAVLDGEVTDYVLDSIAFDRNANVQQFRLTVVLNLTFRDVRQQKVIFREPSFSEHSDFRVPGGGVAQTIGTEQAALRAAAIDIARTIVTRAVDGL